MVVGRMFCGEVNAVNWSANLFFLEVVDVIGVQPKFELVANIVVLFGKEDFSAVFQMKIVIVLATLAGTVGEVSGQKGDTKSASDGNDE